MLAKVLFGMASLTALFSPIGIRLASPTTEVVVENPSSWELACIGIGVLGIYALGRRRRRPEMSRQEPTEASPSTDRPMKRAA